jgi:hypothetical protein
LKFLGGIFAQISATFIGFVVEVNGTLSISADLYKVWVCNINLHLSRECFGGKVQSIKSPKKRKDLETKIDEMDKNKNTYFTTLKRLNKS